VESVEGGGASCCRDLSSSLIALCSKGCLCWSWAPECFCGGERRGVRSKLNDAENVLLSVGHYKTDPPKEHIPAQDRRV
jgi:hypothetical protein